MTGAIADMSHAQSKTIADPNQPRVVFILGGPGAGLCFWWLGENALACLTLRMHVCHTAIGYE